MRGSSAVGVVLVSAWLGAAPAEGQSGPSQAPGPEPMPGSSFLIGPVSGDAPRSPLLPPAPPAKKKEGLVWDNRPAIGYGGWFTLDVRALLDGGVVSTDPDLSGEGADFEWGRRRIGVEGTVTRYVEYQVDYGLDDASTEEVAWRDVYVNVRPAGYAQVQGGKFKIPFGYERLTGPRSLDFVYRARVSDALTPGRSIGVMAHGRAFDRLLRYAAGAFKDGGDQPPALEPVDPLPDEAPPQDEGLTWAARATVAPLRRTSLKGKYNNLEVGGAYTRGTVPEGRNHLQGDTVFGGEFFDRQYYTKGARTRFGLECSWAIGPASLAAEYIVSREARENQGVGDDTQVDNDLPEIEGRGWYIAGTWVVTGENRDGGVNPKRPLLQGGFGAVEVAARYEQLRFASAGAPAEPPSRSPRAANIAGNGDRAWTVGVTWYMNRFAKLRFNVVGERLDDPELGPAPGASSLRTFVMQFQVGF
ncbi:MAG: OprO/OprP family phosphate-selective porin [Rhodospirillaceae bacterium]